MEMHIIHRNMKYDSLEEAYKHKDGLTVLGVFFQVYIYLLSLFPLIYSITFSVCDCNCLFRYKKKITRS